MQFNKKLSANNQRRIQGGGAIGGSAPLDQGNLWISGGFQAPTGAEPPLCKFLSTPLLIIVKWCNKNTVNKSLFSTFSSSNGRSDGYIWWFSGGGGGECIQICNKYSHLVTFNFINYGAMIINLKTQHVLAVFNLTAFFFLLLLTKTVKFY